MQRSPGAIYSCGYVKSKISASWRSTSGDLHLCCCWLLADLHVYVCQTLNKSITTCRKFPTAGFLRDRQIVFSVAYEFHTHYAKRLPRCSRFFCCFPSSLRRRRSAREKGILAILIAMFLASPCKPDFARVADRNRNERDESSPANRKPTRFFWMSVAAQPEAAARWMRWSANRLSLNLPEAHATIQIIAGKPLSRRPLNKKSCQSSPAPELSPTRFSVSF